MDNAKSSLKALEIWAKRVTSDYKDVNVRDMSVSFRDGLAFCAIIHHYRPDLIDFHSLSKENIFENNDLAFSTAEKQLGVPALLDAEDMESYAHPDRLSIITYLAQLHNCFENQNKVNRMKSNLKKSAIDVPSGPLLKVPLLDTKILSRGRHEVCYTCKNRVFILERLIVNSKLYHRTCFRCSKCNAQLNPGDHVEGDTSGLYECSVCPRDQKEYSDPKEESPDETSCDDPQTPVPPIQPVNEIPIQQSPLSASVTSARNSFLQQSLSLKTPATKSVSPLSTINSVTINRNDDLPIINKGVSVKQKISVFETNGISNPDVSVEKSKMKRSLFSEKVQPTVNKELSVTNKCLDDSSNEGLSPAMCEKSNNVIKTENQDFSSANAQPLTEKSIATTNKLFNKNTLTPTSVLSQASDISQSTVNKNTEKVSSLSEKPETVQITQPSTAFKSMTNRQESYNKALSRDIFRPNITPLKLSIASNSNNFKKDSLQTISSLKSADSLLKKNDFDIPLIKSTYSTLPRQKSCTSLSSKESPSQINDSNSDNSLTNLLHKRWSHTTPRRSSFESNTKTNNTLDREISPSIFSRKIFDIGGDPSETLKGSDPRDDIDHSSVKTNEGSISKSDESKSITNLPEEFGVRQADNSEVNSFDTPVPKPRRSLEALKFRDSLNVNETSTNSLEASELFTSNLKTSAQSPNNKSAEDICKVSSVKKVEINDLTKNSSSKEPASATVPKIQLDDKNNEEVYPDDLNPFGDEEDNKDIEYPDDLNPFGEDDEGVSLVENDKSVTDYDESKNPFASDDDESNVVSLSSSKGIERTPVKDTLNFESSFYQSSPSYSCTSSPSGSLRGTTKKRKAPKPPKLSEIFPADSMDSHSDTSFTSLCTSPSPYKGNLTPSPKIRKNKPAPLPPQAVASKQIEENDFAASTKQTKDMDNMKLKSGAASDCDNVNSSPSKWKKKKRPAPPVPIPPRRETKKIPLKEILKEMKEIEEKQKEYEKQGREIELFIRERDKDAEQTFEEEEHIMQLFDLVNQKNALFRRQAELMYIKRSQRLEEEQADLENQIRILMAIPAKQKTEADKLKEEELMLQYIDVVEQRNSIIDSIEMDRRRELEEDCSVQEQLEMKNGDLPIAAEIQEKSKSKGKKSKKKDKKKRQENGSQETGKNTLRKKKWLL